ncbi:hypothetical protein [Thermodesulfobacterium hydrogeniphilum]|uniref:hypothetical protein n=1 Tax=Thermodesulfobacterium hydrogeniphilum TaxID=161156 RepID=UPI00056FAED1|nr:hypothetical protein [Thermodesulfobacterium hydrogeniphilum]
MIILCIIIFTIFFWINEVCAINLSASWHGVEASEAPTVFSQTYSFSFSHELSRTMFFTGSVRYLRTDQKDEYREMITPSLFYAITTDLFNYNFGFSSFQSRSNDRPTFKNYSITNTLSTKIKKTRVSLYYNFGRNWNEATPRTLDNKNESWGLNLSRNFYEKYLKNLSLSYSYHFNKGKDCINGGKTETSTHTFNGRYSKNIGKLNFSIEQKYSTSTTESWYALIGGKAKVEIGLTTNGTIPNPLYDTNATIVKLPSDQSIDGIQFYTDYANRITISSTVFFDIYYSNDGITWNTLATSVSLPYTFSSSISYTWLKLVVKSGAGSPPSGGINLPDPKIVGFYYTTEGHTKRKNTFYTTTGSLSYTFPKDIRTNYFGYYEVQKSDPGNKKTIQNHSFYTSWGGNLYFRPSFSFNISKTKDGSKPETKSTTFSVSVSSTPIDTINLGVGYYNNRYYEGSNKVFKTQFYSFSGVFNIFPDLTLRTNLNYNKNKSYVSKVEQNSYGSSIDLFMRLKSNLTAEFKINYTHSKNTYENGTATSASNQKYGVLIDWRISQILHFTTSQYLNSSSDKTNYTFFYSVYFAPWKRIRLSSSYSGIRNDEKTDNIALNLIWDLGPHINFNTSYTWNKIEGDTKWSWNWTLNLTF